MNSRRDFIKRAALGTAAISIIPSKTFSDTSALNQLTILHTNDMHSHIHPFESGRNKGVGGMAQRATIIKQIRDEGNQVLLLDAGDIFQGTPYFNTYGGELELKLMSEMGYDASTIGNHDFDNGLDGLVNQLPHAKFPFIVSNYDFSNTNMHDKYLKYKVFNKGGIKVGVFGIGIELDGLVPKNLYGNTLYQNPIKKANYYSNYLKVSLGCDLVICLSHLGFKYNTKKMSDKVLAYQTNNIDLIIGGHTHTFLNEPVIVRNMDKKNVQIAQVGWAGINIGRIDYFFNQKSCVKKVRGGSIFIKRK
ncbi:MAG: metallophosphatase [Flavobacteriales bacterium]|nr:metallophosphatase [Flavobacteriales bacterium]|tara:strand:+ start:10843 stop:11757 length:915 start_codon:yes stop_codon:yes gene_type:complete